MKTDESKSLEGLQRTLLIPLWARAKESEKPRPLIVDRRAATILKELKADVAQMDRVFDEIAQLSWAARAKMMDEEIKRFLADHRNAVVVNLGAGLDTTVERIDNGCIRWYDLDLPQVIQVRKRLIPETERSRCISKSVFDLSWFDDIGQSHDGLFFLACGLLPYFRESEVGIHSPPWPRDSLEPTSSLMRPPDCSCGPAIGPSSDGAEWGKRRGCGGA